MTTDITSHVSEVFMRGPVNTRPDISILRTYRYLRIGIAATVVIIAVSVIVASAQRGHVLPSISAYYYTSARTAFVGALIAVGIAIIALSGRGSEGWLMHAAGLFAPLVAFVPTRVIPGTVPNDTAPCPHGAKDCIPSSILPTVQDGVITYVVIGVLMALVALIIGLVTRELPLRSIILTLIVVLAVGAAGLWLDAGFVYSGHVVFAGLFFIIIAFVALRNVWSSDDDIPRSTWVTWVYGIVGIAMAADVIGLLAVVFWVKNQGHLVITGESIALGLFFVFWVVQSIRDWNHPLKTGATGPQTQNSTP
jgi:FtsH-binding integral membrane protein